MHRQVLFLLRWLRRRNLFKLQSTWFIITRFFFLLSPRRLTSFILSRIRIVDVLQFTKSNQEKGCNFTLFLLLSHYLAKLIPLSPYCVLTLSGLVGAKDVDEMWNFCVNIISLVFCRVLEHQRSSLVDGYDENDSYLSDAIVGQCVRLSNQAT